LLLLEWSATNKAGQHRCHVSLGCDFEAGHGKNTLCNPRVKIPNVKIEIIDRGM
jgi:hypothetical protein